MDVLREIDVNKNLAVALGFFDGIHLGHKKIITTLVHEAQARGIESAVITFEKNPANYFNETETPCIQSFKDKEILLEALGVDYLYELDFEQYKELSAENYLEDVLVKNFSPKLVVVGYNHTFGKDKSGNSAFLQNNSSKYNYECIVIPEQKTTSGFTVSSSEIRENVKKGNLPAIKPMLGRNFSVRNSVIKGNKMATSLGYPTANIIWPDSMVKLPYGVYFGFTQLKNKIQPALISWGVRPTLTDGKTEMIEAHIYDFNENLYGKIISVIFSKKLRPEETFANAAQLKNKIRADYAEFQKWAKSLL